MKVSKKIPVKTLSLPSQRKALKNTSKTKGKQTSNRKEVLKTYLDNPFKLDWPPLDYKDYTSLLDLIRESFEGFNLKVFKSLNGPVCHRPRKEQRKELKQRQLKASQEEDPSKSKSRSHFVVGFNAIMRHLERQQLSCVFANIEAKPDIAERMFLPLCSAQQIPLVPLKGLGEVLCQQSTLGIKRCRALALTLAAATSESPFWPLYTLACKALGMERREDGGKVVEDFSPHQAAEEEKVSPPTFTSTQLDKTLTKEEISSMHLKRDSRLVRVFRPNHSNEPASESTSESFISFSSPKSLDDSCAKSKEYPSLKKSEKSPSLASVDASCIAPEDMFVLDVVPTTASPEGEKEEFGQAKEGKRPPYIPARVRRVRRNPNRKGLNHASKS